MLGSGNGLIISYLNINSIRNKIESLRLLISDNVDILIVAETKIDRTFPSTILDKSYQTTEQFDALTGSKCPPPPVSMLFEVETRRLSSTYIQESLLNNIDTGGGGLLSLNPFYY